MSVLAERFAALRRGKAGRFIPFVVAGDPDLPTTAAVLRELQNSNPVAIEVGVPFSDPTADGPVIQRAAQRAIEHNTTLSRILQMLNKLTNDPTAPLVLFSYYNPILQFGIEKFVKTLVNVRIAGVLVVDLPAEAAVDLQQRLSRAGIDLIALIAPTTSDARLRQIAKLATGFIYAVSRTGVTGTARELTDESRELVRRVRAVTNLPVAVGFGITNREQAQRVCRYADAAVVGSRFVAEIERAAARKGATQASIVRAVGRCAREFA